MSKQHPGGSVSVPRRKTEPVCARTSGGEPRLIKRSESMKTRSYIRYLFESLSKAHGLQLAYCSCGAKRVIIIIHKRRAAESRPREASRSRAGSIKPGTLNEAKLRLRAREVSSRYRVERLEIFQMCCAAALSVLHGVIEGGEILIVRETRVFLLGWASLLLIE